jgi:nitrile hydratase
MNGVHDLGGIDGFGPVRNEPDEPVFHEPWEGRVFGMMMLGAGAPRLPLDAARHQLERLPPRQYLTSSYYERWLSTREALIVGAGTLTVEEIDAKVRQFADNPDLPMPHREDPALAQSLPAMFRAGNPASRHIKKRPRFELGARVVARNLNPHGHTRLARYTRGKHGIIAAHHGAHVFPDSNAHGRGENPQHLYTVRFSARELWGDTAEPNESVLIDLWEPYLEAEHVIVKSSGSRPAKAKPSPRPAKIARTARVKIKPARKKGR